MVSHEGVTGLKESAFMGVPMLLIPIHYDEFGNVARHGLGARLQLEKVSAVELGRLIDRVLKDSSYSARAKVMSERLVKLEHESPGVAVIDEALKSCSMSH